MSTQTTVPKAEKIVSRCQSIRSLWTDRKRQQRRELARTRQRQLMKWLSASQAG
jgi:hypothetical protein